jgi:hypothetical protein
VSVVVVWFRDDDDDDGGDEAQEGEQVALIGSKGKKKRGR